MNNVRKHDLVMKSMEYSISHLFVQIGNAVSWFRNQRMQDRGLTSSQAGIVSYIQKKGNPGIMAGELAKGLNLSKATISEMINLLEKKSLIMRRTDENDARKSMIFLTKKGMEQKSFLRNVSVESETILLRGMTEEEQEELNRLLQIVLNNINMFKALNCDSAHNQSGRRENVEKTAEKCKRV